MRLISRLCPIEYESAKTEFRQLFDFFERKTLPSHSESLRTLENVLESALIASSVERDAIDFHPREMELIAIVYLYCFCETTEDFESLLSPLALSIIAGKKRLPDQTQSNIRGFLYWCIARLVRQNKLDPVSMFALTCAVVSPMESEDHLRCAALLHKRDVDRWESYSTNPVLPLSDVTSTWTGMLKLRDILKRASFPIDSKREIAAIFYYFGIA